jgi:hypothetical protein
MKKIVLKRCLLLTTIALKIFIFSVITPVSADQEEDDAMARAQAQMNADVLSQPFLAEKPKEVDAYIKSMLEKKAVPAEYNGSHWRTGYTCRDLLRYNWRQYRNCRYYHRYHGRYYY